MKVVFRNKDLLVVEKPSGLATTSPEGGECLVSQVRAELVPKGLLHPSSRLDREVSGMVTFALTKRGNMALMEARRHGRYVRRYLALTVRSPEPLEGDWTERIAISQRDPRQRVVVEGDRGKTAHTRYQVYATSSAGPVLLSLFPQTGRTHQLRVHASHGGAPMLGDPHYGGPRRTVLGDGRVVVHRRVMLHCFELKLPNPAGVRPAEDLALRSAPPEDFVSCWRALGGEVDRLLR